jgi:hypothetical protein
MFALPTSLPMMTVPIIALPSACTKKSRIDLYQPVFQRTQYRRTLSNYRPEIWETKGKITSYRLQRTGGTISVQPNF